MVQLEPCAAPGQKRTIVSRLFPNTDEAISRRAKYLDESIKRDYEVELEREKLSLTEKPQLPSDDASKPRLDDEIYEQINGAYAEDEEEKPLHRTLGFFGAFWNMVAFSIALGILSIPFVVSTIGIVPFILISLFFAGVTYYIGYSYWRLGMMYPGIHNLQQAGDMLYGPIGGYLLMTIQTIFGIFVQGNHALLGGIAFYELGWHSCMVILVAVFSIISFVFTLPRSYKIFSWQAVISFTSIMTVIIIAMISSGVTGPVNQSDHDPPKRVLAFGGTDQVPHSFFDGMLMVTNVFVSFGATPAYLPVMAEMHTPQDFHRSLVILVVLSTVLYLIVGCVMNYNLGQYSKSPSLGSLSPMMVKVSYGLALPTIMVAGNASGQVTGKTLLVCIFSGARRRWLKNPYINWGTWVLINIFTWTLAFVLAEVIPFFSSFLGLESAVFWCLFLALAALFWFWRHQHDYLSTWRNRIGFVISITLFLVSLYICIAGAWSASVSIRDLYNNGAVGSPFSCSAAY